VDKRGFEERTVHFLEAFTKVLADEFPETAESHGLAEVPEVEIRLEVAFAL
jgi:D-serine dehydratase